MTGPWRLSWLHPVAFAVGLLIVLGVLVQGTIERVNQINRVSGETTLGLADAVAAAVADDVRAGNWPLVQERLRTMVSPHLKVRYRVVTKDGGVVADSQQIRANGQAPPALALTVLAYGRTLEEKSRLSYEMVTAQPLPGADAHPLAALMTEANWERQYLEQRTAIERQAISAALVLLVLVTGAFVAVWRLGILPLHRLRAIAEAAANGASVRAPTYGLADLNAIGRALNRLVERAQDAARLAEDNRALERERDAACAANAAKSGFLARMSHDLRTPLHGIIGFAEMIRDQMVGPIGTAKYVDYARDIHLSGDHLLRLINDVLDLSKIEAGRFELARDHISVASVVGEAVHAVAPLANQRGLDMVVEAARDLPSLTGDERTLRQMLFNLLSNAIKFTDAGGRVTVTVSLGSGGGLDITVADTGVGIDAQDQALIFTEFGQAGNPRIRPAEGTGLGMVIVKSLIELHGGRITLESDSSTGTAVTLSFPPERVGCDERSLAQRT